MQHTIGLVNQKGGVGKTTSAVHLAAGLVELGHRALLIDLDSQANATLMSGFIPNEHANRSMVQVLEGTLGIRDVLLEASHGAALAPSNIGISRTEMALMSDQLSIYKLADALEGLEFDFIVLDCPPAIGGLTSHALAAADHVIITTDLSNLGVEGAMQVGATVNKVRQRVNPKLNLLGVLGTRDRRTRIGRDMLEILRESFGDRVFDTVVHESVKFVEADSAQLTIYQYLGSHPGAAEYRAVVKEVLQRVG